MKTVSKSKLKAKMFEYFRDLESQGGELIVTDFGAPVLRIVPLKAGRSLKDLFSDLSGKGKIDRAAALETTAEEWESDQ